MVAAVLPDAAGLSPSCGNAQMGLLQTPVGRGDVHLEQKGVRNRPRGSRENGLVHSSPWPRRGSFQRWCTNQAGSGSNHSFNIGAADFSIL